MEKKRNSAVRITVYCLLVVFVIAIINLQINMNELSGTIDQQEAEIQALQDNIAESKTRLAAPKDDDYMERLARSYGYYYPDEIIFLNDYGK